MLTMLAAVTHSQASCIQCATGIQVGLCILLLLLCKPIDAIFMVEVLDVVSLGSLGSDPIRERKGQSNGDIILTIC